MSSLRILPLGKGNAFTREDFPTSFVILADEEKILFDCPSPLRRIMFEAQKKSGIELDIDDINHIFLSHLHADHSNGLEEVGYYKTKVMGDYPAKLYLLEENINPLWNNKLKAAMGPDDDSKSLATYFDAVPLNYDQEYDFAFKNGKAKIKITKTIHSLPCYAMLFEYKGKKVGFSADTEFSEKVMELLKPADVIIHDANNSANHTHVYELETLPEEIGNKIYLTHLTDGFDPSSTKMKVAEPGHLINVG